MDHKKPHRQIEHAARLVEEDDEGRTIILDAYLVTGKAAHPASICIDLCLDFVATELPDYDPDDESDCDPGSES